MPLHEVKLTAAEKAVDRVYRSAPVGRFTRDNFGALEPARMVRIMADAQQGDLEDFADLCSYAVRTDPTLRSLVITRLQAVAGADVEVVAGPAEPGEEEAAEAAAAFVRSALERVEEWEDRFADLLWGTFVNVGALENRWTPERDVVWGSFSPLLTRDLRYRGWWDLQARTYAEGVQQWVSLGDHPNKFVVNTPRNISERPTLTGEMYAILWPWLFKRWVEKMGLEGFGKLANGLLFSQVPQDAEQSAVDQRLEDLEQLSTDGAAVFKQHPSTTGPPVELLEAARDPGATQKTLLDYYNAEMAKAVLGSGLNVEVGSTGGNRALGESQFATTILPRLKADAKRALGALRRDFVRPLLAFNRHRFGGRMPPVPRLDAVLVEKKAENTASVGVTQMAVNAGVIKKDELRAIAGLEPLPEGQGGDEFVPSMAPAGPEDEAPGFVAAPEDKAGRARLEHQSGGEWAIVDEDGTVLDVFARKADAVAHLRDLLLGKPDEEAGVVKAPGGSAAPPLARRPRQLRLPLARASTQTASPSPTPLEMALRKPSDDPER